MRHNTGFPRRRVSFKSALEDKYVRTQEHASVKNSYGALKQMGRTPLLSAKLGNRSVNSENRKQYHPTLCLDIYYVFNGFIL